MTKKNNTELEPIAIIGMSCVFPQAADIESFWNNILGCVDAITEPADVWDADRYLDSGRINTPFGGFLKELYRFDPREFGIMPNSVDGGEPDQYLALRVTRDALKDSGYLREDYDHTDTGIVLGHSTYLHRGQGVLVQQHIVLDQTIDLLQEVMPSLDDEKLASIKALLRSKLPPTNADTSPGLVPNVMTGRIANRLNLRGPNYLVDAACSSSLLAVNSAMDELRNGRSRIMIAGGVNASLPAEVSVIFTQLGALSARGKVRPFENGSDGTLLGEGLGVVVLKRLSDAIEDKDKVYAVIRGIGQASDGKGHGLLAPSVEGETLAIQRAYDSAAIEPSTIGMIEAHGTGIPLGDKTEVSALRNVFGERNGDHTAIALGSVKSMISHCIPAAGIAGLIKSALALHHKVLPPTLCADVNQTLGINSTPLYVNTESLPWIKKAGFPRRAGINSFGFGGINTHAILEEAPPASVKPETCLHWPAELCVFSASSREKLLSKIRQLIEFLKVDNDYRLVDIANALHRNDSNESCRLAIVHNDKEGLTKKLNQAINQIQNNDKPQWSTRNGVIFSEVTNDGKLAFIFPGEGSQYIGMFKDLAICFDEVREWFDYWSSLYGEEPDGSTRTDIVFSPASEMSDEKMARLELRLHSMDIGSEAVFIGGQAMFSLLVSLGVEADVMLGHSSGESSALAASGAMKYKSREQLAGYIRRLNEIYKDVLGSGGIPTGALLTVGALPQHTVEHFIQEVDKNIHIAMDNCINQLVLFGDKLSIDKLQEVLSDAGGICILLPFDRGYHTPLFSAVSKAFLDYYDEIGLGKPGVPLYSCASTEIFPESKKDIKKLAASQWSNRVRFRETIENMHKDGVRYFIEVGPSGNLSSFVNDVLVGKDYVSMATNIRRKNSVEQVLVVLGNLYVNGKNPDIAKLFKSRAVRDIDLSIIESRNSYGILLDNTMPVIQLDSSDRKQLRSIIAHDIVASNTGQAVNIGEGSNPVVSGADDVVAASGRDSVMTDYFSLMSDFLEKQHSLMGLIADGNDEQSSENKDFPFITNIIDSNDNYIRAAVYLNDYDDNFLKDHVISGVVSDDPDLKGLSCVPMMVSLEIMAEACCLLAGRNDLAVIKNVAAFDWIALDDNELELEVYVELLSNEDATYKAILSNNSSTIISTEFSFAKDWVCQAIPQLKAGREFRWKESEMYTEGMFHGPVFQSLHRITGWDDEGIDAELSKVSLSDFFVKTEKPRMVLNPVLLDAFGQIAAFWIAQQIGTDFNSFPSTIERIELYSQCPENMQGLKLYARQIPVDGAIDNIEAARSWQFDCVDADGRSLVRATSLLNIYFPVPNRFYKFRHDPLNGWLGGLYHSGETENVLLWELPHFSDEFCAQSGGVFMRILAHALLSHEERDEWRLLESPMSRKREWLLGRACIKEAVRYWIYKKTGSLLYPSDIIVCHDDLGAPFITGWWCGSLYHAPTVSLSHNKNKSIVAVTDAPRSIGVDVEEIGRIQKPELVFESLTMAEKSFFNGIGNEFIQENLLRFWCAKEAASKYLGLGLQGRPDAFEVSLSGADWGRLKVSYSNEVVDVVVDRVGESILALAS